MDSLNSSSSFKLQPSSSFSSSSPLIPTTLAISPTLSRMLERFTFTGFDVDGRLLLRSHRYIRFIPRRPITFTSLPWSGLMGDNLPVIYNYFDTVNPDSNSDSLATVGWKRLRSGKSSLVIQDGLFYSNNVKSTASYFFNVTSDGAKIPSLRSLVLDISANYDTEEGCDFLTARLLCYHQVTPSTHPTSPPDNRLLFSVSGSQGRISRSFGLVNHISASCNVVELQITFESDEAVMGGRVEVQNIEIRKDKDE